MQAKIVRGLPGKPRHFLLWGQMRWLIPCHWNSPKLQASDGEEASLQCPNYTWQWCYSVWFKVNSSPCGQKVVRISDFFGQIVFPFFWMGVGWVPGIQYCWTLFILDAEWMDVFSVYGQADWAGIDSLSEDLDANSQAFSMNTESCMHINNKLKSFLFGCGK